MLPGQQATSECTLSQFCCLQAAVMSTAGWLTCLRAPALTTSLYPDVLLDGFLLIDIALLVLQRNKSFSLGTKLSEHPCLSTSGDHNSMSQQPDCNFSMCKQALLPKQHP